MQNRQPQNINDNISVCRVTIKRLKSLLLQNIQNKMRAIKTVQYILIIVCYLFSCSSSGSGIVVSLDQIQRFPRCTYNSNQCVKRQIKTTKQIVSQRHIPPQQTNLTLNEHQFDSNQANQPELVQQILQYSRKFRKLNFSLQQQELQIIAEDVKTLCYKDKDALFFISAYFVRACQILQQTNMTALQISKLLKKKIKYLMQITSIENYRLKKYGNNSQSLPDEAYWEDVITEMQQFLPKKFFLNQDSDKDTQIEDIIVQMVQQGRKKFQLFNLITSQSCNAYQAQFHHINFKINNKSQRQQMKRVKQKLLRQHIYKFQKVYLSHSNNISQKRIIQQSGFQNILEKVYSQLRQVQFVVKDILRSKCMFKNIIDIKNAILHLKKMIKQLRKAGHNIRLVEFQNRLNKTTCDIIMIIQIDEFPCELQLALQFDEIQFQISHKMYEMMRSKVFSPIVLIFDWFQKSAPDFLSKIGQAIIKNQKSSVLSRDSFKITDQNMQILLTQYQLLNKFFHLTSYQDLQEVSEQELENQIKQQIQKSSEQLLIPYIEMGPGPQ